MYSAKATASVALNAADMRFEKLAHDQLMKYVAEVEHHRKSNESTEEIIFFHRLVFFKYAFIGCQ